MHEIYLSHGCIQSDCNFLIDTSSGAIVLLSMLAISPVLCKASRNVVSMSACVSNACEGLDLKTSRLYIRPLRKRSSSPKLLARSDSSSEWCLFAIGTGESRRRMLIAYAQAFWLWWYQKSGSSFENGKNSREKRDQASPVLVRQTRA